MTLRLADARLLINEASYGQSQCLQWSCFLRDWFWPIGCQLEGEELSSALLEAKVKEHIAVALG